MVCTGLFLVQNFALKGAERVGAALAGSDTPIGLYGSTPFLLAHGAARSAGVLWLNSADTYIDLWRETRVGDVGSTGGAGKEDLRVSGQDGRRDFGAAQGVGSHWLSEAGALELFLFAGPSPQRVVAQHVALTGLPAMPPLWAMGYQHSHWNIRSQEQVCPARPACRRGCAPHAFRDP